jgi:aminomethyltransferase
MPVKTYFHAMVLSVKGCVVCCVIETRTLKTSRAGYKKNLLCVGVFAAHVYIFLWRTVAIFRKSRLTGFMKTPLYGEHLALGARIVPFAGWDMPLLYRGIIAEHLQTRERASVFDVFHMGEFELTGPTAEADMERLVTQPVASLKSGACAYGYLLADDGGVLDDLICYRMDAGRFWLVVNAGTAADDAAWIQSHLSAGTVFTDLSPRTAKLDIQGPRSRELMEQSLGIALPDLGYFRFQELTLLDAPCLLSRTGYTGEFGYELFLPAGEVIRFWKRILASQQILPAGLGARDTLRIEMGYPLYGHELTRERTPAGAAPGRATTLKAPFMDLAKPFIGRDAVCREIEDGLCRVLVGLRLEGRMAARAKDRVLQGERAVGEVASGMFAPSLGVAVALAYVERAVSGAGQRLEIEVRGKSLPAVVVSLPFYQQGTARRK